MFRYWGFFYGFCCVCQVKDEGLVNDEKTDEEEAPQQHEESVIGIMETIYFILPPVFSLSLLLLL